MAETQKEKLMRVLGISAAEAEEVMAYDRAVEKGQKTEYDLSKEQEKETRKYRQSDRKPFVPKLEKRERKPNEAKRDIIQTIQEALVAAGAEDVQLTNIERQIDFLVDGVRYRVVLSAPRK